jgi:hypothetical protein
MKLNETAVAHARELVSTGKYALNTIWIGNRPNDVQIARYTAEHGADALGRWFLATDESGAPILPLGDFTRIHRTGVTAAKRAAEQAGREDIAEAAESILELFDRMNAC